MLAYLHVKNLALIKDSEMNLSEGLNILSGETGAGKSILLGSVDLALGKKADAGMIRSGAEEAFVELVFRVEDPETVLKLTELGVEPDDGIVIIQRRIREGRSIAKLNGASVTNQALKSAAELLIDIHGQHEHQSLLKEENHLKVLDHFGKEALQEKKEAYLSRYKSYRTLREKVREMGGNDEDRKREIDFLRFEIDEIEDADVKPGEEEKVTKEFIRRSNARNLIFGLENLRNALSEEAASGISESIQAVSEIRQYDESLKDLHSSLIDMESMIQDLVRETDRRIRDTDADDGLLKELSDRLDTLVRLKKKYGGSEEEILKSLSGFKKKYDELVAFDENKEEVLKELDDEKKKLVAAAKELRSARMVVASEFDRRMTESLMDLNFLSVDFRTEVREVNRYTSLGADEVEFMISLNPGEPIRPLVKVASGGELSRIMLAIKALSADEEDTDTMIFDEIDTGISGITAKAVAGKLSEIGARHQVICISHLPQIVAAADHHFLIEKNAVDGETVTSISALSEEESIRELARLLGAGSYSEIERENARELRKAMKFNMTHK